MSDYRLTLTLATLLLVGCGSTGGGKVTGWVDKAEGDCALPKTELKYGLAYVDADLVDRGLPAKVVVVLSDASLSSIDLEKGLDPFFGQRGGKRQLLVLQSFALHGLGADNLEFVHPTKSCGTSIGSSRVALTVGAFGPDRVALKLAPRAAEAGAEGPRDAAQIDADLPLVWPKKVPAAQREAMAAEIAARARFEREALATYQELAQAVAARDIAGIEKRVAVGGYSGFDALLEEMVFGEPGEHTEAAKILPTVAAMAPESWVYTRRATAADSDWELTLALCDPADATRRGTAKVKRQPDGQWRVTGSGDAETAAAAFGPAPAACTALVLAAK